MIIDGWLIRGTGKFFYLEFISILQKPGFGPPPRSHGCGEFRPGRHRAVVILDLAVTLAPYFGPTSPQSESPYPAQEHVGEIIGNAPLERMGCSSIMRYWQRRSRQQYNALRALIWFGYDRQSWNPLNGEVDFLKETDALTT